MHHFGEGKARTQPKLTSKSCCVVMSCLFSDPQIFRKRIITFIMDFPDLQFVLERHFIRLLAVCVLKAWGKYCQRHSTWLASPLKYISNLTSILKVLFYLLFFNLSIYLFIYYYFICFILEFLNNNYDQIKNFSMSFSPLYTVTIFSKNILHQQMLDIS